MNYRQKVNDFSDKWLNILESNDEKKIFSNDFLNECRELEFDLITDEDKLSDFIDKRTGALGSSEIHKCQTNIKDVGTLLLSSWNQFKEFLAKDKDFPVNYLAFMNGLNYLKYLSSDRLEKDLGAIEYVTINTFPHKKERGENKFPQSLTIKSNGEVFLEIKINEKIEKTTALIDENQAKEIIRDLYIGFNGFKAIINIKNIGGWKFFFNEDKKEYVKGKYGKYFVNGIDISEKIRKIIPIEKLTLFDNK